MPGETALAFYTARNPTDKAVTGIATYNVIPFEAGLYFNKIQCFCFEEQRLNPREQVNYSYIFKEFYHCLRHHFNFFIFIMVGDGYGGNNQTCFTFCYNGIVIL